jgi:uroporphyrin-III C-methyltransferase
MEMSGTGKVFLVGAGPGAPDLITLRGVAALGQADVVLYDRLVHPSVLDHAPAGALRVYAGRAPGEPCRDRQEAIHRQLIEHARAGRTVVRLKGGDPFVFGRGGEELLALARAGVACEVVPGVTAATAVPAAALVPVTHRGVSAAFAVFTGHDTAEGSTSGVDWALAATIPTAVFLMGVLRLREIVGELIAHGRAPDTPAMMIERGTLPDQRIASGQLADLPDAACDLRPPATLIVGDVVRVQASVAAAARDGASEPVAQR